MEAISVREASQVGEARRRAVAITGQLGFGEMASARAAIVATELATNLIKHGGGGAFLVGSFEDETGAGLECLALDKGVGMQDVDACLSDGYSTAGSAGAGLGAVARQSRDLEIYSRPGQGTAILVRLCAQGGPGGGAYPTSGAIAVPYPGEIASGDAWATHGGVDGFRIIVADGLGHGPIAAEASTLAVRTFERTPRKPPPELLLAMHAALRSTRGAAVGIAAYDSETNQVVFAGVGNIAGTVVDADGARRMVSHNGTVGHTLKRVQSFTYPVSAPFLTILASDGLATSWSLDNYPGLQARHPTLIAAVLYRDFQRGADDVTVVVTRESGG